MGANLQLIFFTRGPPGLCQVITGILSNRMLIAQEEIENLTVVMREQPIQALLESRS